MLDNRKFMESQIEDLIRDPGKYGAPTFAEFCRNPDKYRKNKEQTLITADGGSKVVQGIQKHKYSVEGVECESLEQAQRIISDMGLKQEELEFGVNLEDVGNHKIVAHVNFRRKSKLILPEGM